MTSSRRFAVLFLTWAAACLAADQVPAPETLYETSFEKGETLPEGWSVDFGSAENVEWVEIQPFQNVHRRLRLTAPRMSV